MSDFAPYNTYDWQCQPTGFVALHSLKSAQEYCQKIVDGMQGADKAHCSISQFVMWNAVADHYNKKIHEEKLAPRNVVWNEGYIAGKFEMWTNDFITCEDLIESLDGDINEIHEHLRNHPDMDWFWDDHHNEEKHIEYWETIKMFGWEKL